MTTHQGVNVREIWEHNIVFEFKLIEKAIKKKYTHVSFDLEFAGLPITLEKNDWTFLASEALYIKTKLNVDQVKMVQVGLALSNEQGDLPVGPDGNPVAWQINLSGFDAALDLCDSDSLEMLRNKIDLNAHSRMGVPPPTFGAFFGHILMSNHDNLSFICFHGITDFAFLVKAVNQDRPLPDSLRAFMHLLGGYFGTNIYDIKHLVRYSEVPEFVRRFGVDNMAIFYGLGREAGSSHQGGSDALITLRLFWLKDLMEKEDMKAIGDSSGGGKKHW